jgi:Zn ribbon nucleic-acid-binding protein
MDTICPILIHSPAQNPMNTVCKHPRVRVVAREDDVEFVECLDCGEVFDSNEFRDMAIEEMQAEEEETA